MPASAPGQNEGPLRRCVSHWALGETGGGAARRERGRMSAALGGRGGWIALISCKCVGVRESSSSRLDLPFQYCYMSILQHATRLGFAAKMEE